MLETELVFADEITCCFSNRWKNSNHRFQTGLQAEIHYQLGMYNKLILIGHHKLISASWWCNSIQIHFNQVVSHWFKIIVINNWSTSRYQMMSVRLITRWMITQLNSKMNSTDCLQMKMSTIR